MGIGDYVIYTAMFGGYDYAPSPRGAPYPGARCMCFTDRPRDIPEGWTVAEMAPPQPTAPLANRHVKLFPHLYLEGDEVSLYVDANVALRRDPRPLVERSLARSSIAIPRHPLRDCVYEEAAHLMAIGVAPIDETMPLMERYRAAGFPPHAGMTENFLIARRHHDPAVVRLAEAWWEALERGPHRDQLHLPFVAWRSGMPLAMDESSRELRWLLRRLPHRPRHGWLQQRFYRLLARRFPDRLGRLMERGIAAYNRVKGVDL